MDSPLDPRFFTPTWNDPAPEYSFSAIELSSRVLRTGVLDMPAWVPRTVDRVDGVNLASALTTQKGHLADIAHAMIVNSGAIDRSAPVSCAAVPSLTAMIMPAARRLAARGVSVDFLAPPYSLAYYFQVSDRFARLMALRRCALEMTRWIPGARLFSFDTDLKIVGDLSNYSDAGHIREYSVYDGILRSIANGQDVVPPGRWGAVEAKLKRDLAAFQLPSG
jgi:hypothetical protein